jgi:hypothetical protein
MSELGFPVGWLKSMSLPPAASATQDAVMGWPTLWRVMLQEELPLFGDKSPQVKLQDAPSYSAGGFVVFNAILSLSSALFPLNCAGSHLPYKMLAILAGLSPEGSTGRCKARQMNLG